MKQKEEKSKKAKKKKYRTLSLRQLPYDFILVTGALPMWFVLRPKIYRLSKEKVKGGGIVMSNHVGLCDIVSLHFAFAGRRLWSLATKELFDTKLKNAFFKTVNCIKVDRDNVTIDMYHDVADVLSSDKLLIIFPEGHINSEENPHVENFKGGVALFSIMNKTPVIPVYLVKRTKWYQRQKIVIGEPIYLEQICEGTPSLKDVNRVSEYLHSKEEELARYYEENILKKGEKK